jgi:hypothetical protein
VAVSVFSANVGFINFNLTHQRAKLWIVEHRSHAMADIESGLVCGLASVLREHPLDLHRAHTFLALANQVDHFKPDGQRIVSVLEHGADQSGEAIALPLADFYFTSLLVDCLSTALADPIPRAMLDLKYFVIAASRAAHVIGPAQVNQQRHAFVLGVEVLVNLLKARHKRTLHQMRWWCQVRLHANPRNHMPLIFDVYKSDARTVSMQKCDRQRNVKSNCKLARTSRLNR